MSVHRATIKDVAKRAGVSIATVSNVVNNSKPVTADLQRRVEDAARELSYTADRAASRLRSGQARIVGILVPDLEDSFFTSLISRLEVLAGEDRFDVIVASSRDNEGLEESRLAALLGWRPSGLVIVPCSDRLSDVIAEEAGRLPIVLADRVDGAKHPVDVVTIDNFAAGDMAARYLANLGHENVLVAASVLSISPISERIRGVVARIPGAEVIEVGANAGGAGRIIARRLGRGAMPSAIFGLTNVTTLGALSALAARGIEVPRDVSLVGFDDYDWMSARKTPLTAVRQPIDKIACTVWEMLMARIGQGATTPRRVTLMPTLEIRASARDLDVGDMARKVSGHGTDAESIH